MQRRRGLLKSALALPIAFAALLVLGAVAAALHGRLTSDGVLSVAAAITLITAAVAELPSIPLIAAIAWLTVTGFSGSPYGRLHTDGHQAVVVGSALVAASLGGYVLGVVIRWRHDAARTTALVAARASDKGDHEEVTSVRRTSTSLRDLADAISHRRQLSALAVGAILLPIMTLVLSTVRSDLDLDDDLLLYLVLVMGVTLIGGFWPAVAAAIASSILLNWFFTPPLHNWTIDSPQNLTALLLFITVAVTASSVVHLAARRAAVARRSQAESSTLLTLAQTVLGGLDTASDVLHHLAEHQMIGAELQERVSGRWVRVAGAGEIDEYDDCRIMAIRDDLRLRLFGDPDDGQSSRTLDGYAAQAAAALDRERLRTQAAQAEILGAGNRMRTALLAAVSHDLRTPLASVKASVSALRQSDVAWTPADEAELLATIEENADRLDGLIANLLDMSRIHTGSLQPLLRPVSLDEIAPLALRGLDGSTVVLDLPDGLPTVATDPGLLERAVANLVSNAVRYSPAGQPPELRARAHGRCLTLDIIDHGPGVAPADRDGMFLPFQQLGDQRNATGVGLGLAVARGFVEAVGGTLTAHQTPAGGLTMRIELETAAVLDDTPATP